MSDNTARSVFPADIVKKALVLKRRARSLKPWLPRRGRAGGAV